MTQILEIRPDWHGTFDNPPTTELLVDNRPHEWIYEKIPFGRNDLSDEQMNIVGGSHRIADDGWHLYYASSGPLVTFFTWGGVPDQGFGGAKRTIKLTDGSTEEIIGGWHPASACARLAGKPNAISVSVFDTREAWHRGYTAFGMFADEELVLEAYEALRPDVVVEPGQAPRWYGRWPKSWHQTYQRGRVAGAKEAMQFLTGTEYEYSKHKDWPLFQRRPYGELGPGRERVEHVSHKRRFDRWQKAQASA